MNKFCSNDLKSAHHRNLFPTVFTANSDRLSLGHGLSNLEGEIKQDDYVHGNRAELIIYMGSRQFQNSRVWLCLSMVLSEVSINTS